MRTVAVALLLALAASCGAADPPACPLGRTVACACPDGTHGAQECGPLGVWSACVCGGSDAGADAAVADASTPDAMPDADPASCLGPCGSNSDCESACRVSSSDQTAYCCVEGRCAAAQGRCADIPASARLCSSPAWVPVCQRSADCTLLCGARWSCVRAASGLARCAPIDVDAGVDATATDAVADAVTVPDSRTQDASCALSMCSGRCVDTTRDASNCGACGVACVGAANADPACSSSMCAIACRPGFANCDGRASNGCEADLSTPTYCGSCSSICRTNVVCVGGACVGCLPNFGDCDGLSANGCEVDLRYDAANCGVCGRACTRSCFGGVCS